MTTQPAMTTPFGPQLIGETEKTLNAVLRAELAGTGLDEPQWVTLRLASQHDGTGDAAALVRVVADRAHLADADLVVERLTDAGLLDDGALTPAGRSRLDEVQASVANRTAGIWDGLPADDVAAATRVLNEVVARARAVL